MADRTWTNYPLGRIEPSADDWERTGVGQPQEGCCSLHGQFLEWCSRWTTSTDRGGTRTVTKYMVRQYKSGEVQEYTSTTVRWAW